MVFKRIIELQITSKVFSLQDKYGYEQSLFRNYAHSISNPSHNNVLRQTRQSSLLTGINEIERPTISDQNENDGHPYLDEEGNICQDRKEIIQRVEYDTQIHCEVSRIFNKLLLICL